MSNISKNLRNARTDAGYTQSQLAKELGVSQTAIALWENGTREPNSDTIEKLADIFSTKPSYLMGWQDEEVEIDSKIEQIIERIENEDLEQAEVSRLVQKMSDLMDEQLDIENNINEQDSKFYKNLSDKSVYFDSDEYSESELEEIRDFAEFIKSKRKMNSQDIEKDE
ncbi:MAG: helix-turn-helix domain-containing protein [Hespellia sp.]|nr:helix-turn-helix domain-containing protein [Hespellia sp.]